jgi:hypothetical protein
LYESYDPEEVEVMIPILGKEMAGARIARLLEEAEGSSRARAARARGGRGAAKGVRAAVGRRLVGLGFRLIGTPVEVS